MARYVNLQKGISSIFFWSIISAAFIGPGTVTTTSRAGSLFGADLLWTLAFSSFATILLQETTARLSIVSGKNLGAVIAHQYKGKHRAVGLLRLIFGALVFGCAAYEAGNLLGAVAGLGLLCTFPRPLLTLLLGLLCSILLWTGNLRIIARLMGILVAAMGITFIFSAVHTPISGKEILVHTLIPSAPAGSAMLIIGLIGTTIVPYNLFLGSGIGYGQKLWEMRWGIAIAVIIGGLISGAILLVGTQISGEYSYDSLAHALGTRFGQIGKGLFGLGLFAAGFSSAITAPLAAAIAARSLFGESQQDGGDWGTSSKKFRMVWGSVLATGMVFGILDVRPIPVIILAQALNGLLLPMMTIFLLFAANDRALLGKFANGKLTNILTLSIVGITIFLGLHNILLAINHVIGVFTPGSVWPLGINLAITIVALILLGIRVFRQDNATDTSIKPIA
jgi:manganese transport protein